MDIPFQTIYSEGRIESLLRLDAPTVSIGYEPSQKIGSSADIVREECGVESNEYGSDSEILDNVGNPPSQMKNCDNVSSRPRIVSAKELSLRLKTEGNCATYIRILAILDPPLPRPEIKNAEEEQLQLFTESELLQTHAIDWLKSLQAGKEATGFFTSIICGTKRSTTMSSTHSDHPLKCELILSASFYFRV